MTANCIIAQPAASIQAAPGGKRCLSCRSRFASGGCHEWVCPRCKESETWQAGLSEFAYPQTQSRGDAE
jgi:Zn finger protein HypA/HybF involved in hydrogenase expression